MEIRRIDTTAKLSKVVVANGFAFISGQVGKSCDASARTQAEEIFAKADGYLAQAGTSKDKLVSATVWVKDLNELPEINAAWEAWIPNGTAPSRSCVQSTPASSQFAVAIAFVATL